MRVAKSLAVYAFAMFFNAAVSFATFSIVTRHLNEVDFGIINLYNSFTIFIVPFVSIGIQFTLGVDYFRMDEKSYRSHFTNALVIPVIMSTLITIIFLICYFPLQKLIKTNLFFLLTLPLNCLLIVSNEVILNMIRNKGRHYLFAGFSITKNLVETGVTIFLIVMLGLTWKGRLGGALISLLLTGCGVVYLINRWKLFTGVFNKQDIKKILRNGLPFIPERLAIFVLAYSDRFFIDYYNGTGDVGFYGAGAQIALIVNLTILSLISAFQPYLYKNIASSSWSNVRKATIAFVAIAAFVAASVILTTPLFFRFFIGENFQKGQVYAKYLTVGFFLWAVYAAFVSFLLYIKLNKAIMTISIAGMILSITLNFINVKYFGAIGATYTSMIVYFFMAAACIYTVSRKFNLRKILFQPSAVH
jgi:O-antigen/teichoic acid export membrane protein